MNENSHFIGNDYMKIKVIRIFAHNFISSTNIDIR
jgi:hypothetical protein